MEFDEAHSGFSPPGRFDQSDVVPIGHLDGPMVTPTANEPYMLHSPPPQANWTESGARWHTETPAPVEGEGEEVDLESALQALDVDLDDLSMPHGPTELARQDQRPIRASIRPPSSSQLPSSEPARKSGRVSRGGGRAPRSTTEDGVLIDFDDDDSD